MKIFSKHETRRRLIHSYHDTDDLTDRIGDWFRSPLGQSVWSAEKAITDQLISRLFGYHILQIGCHEEFSLIANSPVGHKVMFRPAWRAGSAHPVALSEELPVTSDSVDVVVLHHALDFTEQDASLADRSNPGVKTGWPYADYRV